ncbi:MAG: UDP-N-acetylmuramate:L-alanyl-gamma-D-glutamyl-meso-diaminopimelate ligase [Acidobacteriota bacterium]
MQSKHFHLIGVCGTAMASLAGMLKTQGHRVTGSDKAFYPPMSDELKRLEIDTREGFSAANLEPAPDVVVIGNATSRGNVEIEETLNSRLRYASMPEVLREYFIRGKQSTVVAGTHGKTTTTSLLAWIMETGGFDPTFLVGGVVENFGSSFKIGASQHSLIEGDEYDTAFFDKGPKFLHYLPDLVILNNIEYDHADIYADLEAVRKSFRLLVNMIPSQGRLLAGWDSPVVREVIEHPVAPQGVWCPVESFATAWDEAHWTAREIEFAPDETRFEVRAKGISYGRFRTPLAGLFNVRNCLGAIGAAEAMGVPRQAIAEALATFKSVKRRMEVRGIVDEIVVVDDFAHHPTAVRETLLAAAQRYPGRRIIAVYEPRTWTARKRIFQEQYREAFAPADVVVIAGLFEAAQIAADEQLSIDELISGLAADGKHATTMPHAGAIVDRLSSELSRGDVVVVMSNGGFGGIHEKLLSALERHHDKERNQ